MSNVLFHTKSGTHALTAAPGQTLYDVLSAFAVDESIHAPCAGRGLCRRCLVRAEGALSYEPGARPDNADGLCLACRTVVRGDCQVWPVANGDMQTAEAVSALDTAGLRRPDCPPDALGIAVDIGTTTVAAFLFSLFDGRCLATHTQENNGRAMGADVITRMQWVMDHADGSRRMVELMRKQLADMSAVLCDRAGKAPDLVTEFALGGNTAMLHLLTGLPVRSLAQLPFEPVDRFGYAHPGSSLFPDSFPHAYVYLTPVISAYVGGDITAAVLASDVLEGGAPAFLLDIGTNGEMALSANGHILCCATASGPAFEGGGLTHGLPGLPGAIDHIFWDGSALTYSTIAGAPPRGLCGSGLLDALAAMLAMDVLDETGRLLPREEIPANRHSYINEADGEIFFVLDADSGVSVSASDVRHLQLAKAAMAAGIDTLLAEAGLRAEEVTAVCLAGGFGSFLQVESACAIGLIPAAWRHTAKAVGNAAGQGVCRLLLSEALRLRANSLAESCKTVSLATHPVFQAAFMDHIGFN